MIGERPWRLVQAVPDKCLLRPPVRRYVRSRACDRFCEESWQAWTTSCCRD